MLYWRRFLVPDEQLKHAFGVSSRYMFLFWLLPFFLLIFMALVVTVINAALGLMLLIAPLGMLLPILYLTFFVHYAITDKRVLRREGVLHKKFVAVQMQQITDISVRESLLERLFTKTGTIGMNTAGSPWVEMHFRHVAYPLRLREDIYQHQTQIMEIKLSKNHSHV